MTMSSPHESGARRPDGPPRGTPDASARNVDPARCRPGARIVLIARTSAALMPAVPALMDVTMREDISIVGSRRLSDGSREVSSGGMAPVAAEFHAAGPALPDPLGEERIAADLEFAQQLRAALAARDDTEVVCAITPDVLVEPGPRLVVSDVDSTAITAEVIDLLADRAGRHDEVATITDRAMRGKLDFAASLRERVATLAGLPASVCAQVRAELQPTPGTITMVDTVHATGGMVAWVSGGFHDVIDEFATGLGIDAVVANTLAVDDGALTGQVVGDIVDAQLKESTLRTLAARHHIPMHRCIAVGDGANDLPMLHAAGLGVAFDAKPTVRARADVALPGWATLASVLYLLGFTADEFT